ncbi:MAG: hypothetical protein AABX37_04610, partial [Nanoarchaeota archaeon]
MAYIPEGRSHAVITLNEKAIPRIYTRASRRLKMAVEETREVLNRADKDVKTAFYAGGSGVRFVQTGDIDLAVLLGFPAESAAEGRRQYVQYLGRVAEEYDHSKQVLLSVSTARKSKHVLWTGDELRQGIVKKDVEGEEVLLEESLRRPVVCKVLTKVRDESEREEQQMRLKPLDIVLLGLAAKGRDVVPLLQGNYKEYSSPYAINVWSSVLVEESDLPFVLQVRHSDTPTEREHHRALHKYNQLIRDQARYLVNHDRFYEAMKRLDEHAYINGIVPLTAATEAFFNGKTARVYEDIIEIKFIAALAEQGNQTPLDSFAAQRLVHLEDSLSGNLEDLIATVTAGHEHRFDNRFVEET